MSDEKPEVIELNGSESPNGSIRVTLDIELPHAEAMGILTIVHEFKDKARKAKEAAGATRSGGTPQSRSRRQEGGTGRGAEGQKTQRGGEGGRLSFIVTPRQPLFLRREHV